MSRERSDPADLPSGTVTFLFTDIEGSTKLLRELGAEGYEGALANHRRVLRQAFLEHGGIEVDTQGDAFFVAFADAAAAVRAAADAQRGLGNGRVLVRMGVHSGNPRVTDEGYVGHDVHLGARIAAAAHGGQVLLSQTTRRLVEDEVTDLGEHRVKDFPEPVWIYQLGTERFPPLKTISNTNLPRPASSFIGREREVSEITAHLRDGARMLTLTGPGGTGKTRLAIEAATELVPANRNGVFWVALAAIADPALVTSQIAQTLGAKDSIAEHVGEREMLLLLDNFEQVVDAAPELSALLAECPNLRLLVTSRERLRVQGEVAYAVPPLAEPDAVELFCTRAGVDADETVTELCRRLDNLPLAVELAAARAGVLSPSQILGRLSQRLDLLKGGRDADARQQTLRATIEWSHDLLKEEEKALFARLAVFRGGCTLEAAEQVAEADLDTLESLVDKSLVRHSGERFWMLETIREFALERLDASGAADAIRSRHAQHFLALASEAEDKLEGSERDDWSELLERDHENLRAAIDHFESIGDFELAMRLAGSIGEFWDARGHHAEALRRYTRLLRADARPTLARARALDGAAHMVSVSGDLEMARQWAQQALELYRRFGDERGVTSALWGLGYFAVELGDYATAEPILNEVVERFARAGVGAEANLAWATRTLAFTYEELGNRERARELFELCLQRAQTLGERSLEAAALGALSGIAMDEGRIHDAVALRRKSLQPVGLMSDRLIWLARLCGAASTLASLGDAVAAAQLLGYDDSEYEQIGAREPWVDRMNQQTMARIHDTIDEAAFAGAWANGRALTEETAVALGMAALGKAAQ